MKVLVTGATGFVGRAVVRTLLDLGDEVTAVVRTLDRVKALEWRDAVRFVVYDMHDAAPPPIAQFGPADTVMHLAWQGLPNYDQRFHFEENLPANYRFLKTLLKEGYKHILVTGTCLEYGLKNGGLVESTPCDPVIPYSIAKDTLRRFMESLQKETPFVFQWARLFYIYGDGQNPKSLLSQLDAAIDEGRKSFDMSRGDQLRDYSHVNEIAAMLVDLLRHPELTGPTNICSGIPISVRSLVERHLERRGAQIKLNLGHYSYTDYEPMAFWGERRRLAEAVGDKEKCNDR